MYEPLGVKVVNLEAERPVKIQTCECCGCVAIGVEAGGDCAESEHPHDCGGGKQRKQEKPRFRSSTLNLRLA